MATTITITFASQARKVCTCNSSPARCRVCRTPTIFVEGSSDESLESLKEEIDPGSVASVTTTSAQGNPLPATKECAVSLPSLRRNYAQENLREHRQIQKVMASAISAVRRSVDPARLQTLRRLQCSIFSTTYNPTNARNGAKYLKGRLRGPSMVRYYPPRITFRDIEKMLHGEFGVTDLAEQQRLDDVEERKRRGKGTPKKAKKKEDSRRAAKKRR